MPKVKPTAWMHAIREKQIPTAPVASVPSEETVRLSIRLAAEVISILAMAGSASESRSLGMGACIMRSCSADDDGDGLRVAMTNSFLINLNRSGDISLSMHRGRRFMRKICN